jgi:hypothetical protein
MSIEKIREAIGQNSAYYNPKYQGIVIEFFDHLQAKIATKVLPCGFETAMQVLN